MESVNQMEFLKNRRDAADLRRKHLEKYDHSCVSCGAKNDIIRLELAYIIPVSRGSDSSEDNLTLLCPNCHRTFNRQPREYEFVSFPCVYIRSVKWEMDQYR